MGWWSAGVLTSVLQLSRWLKPPFRRLLGLPECHLPGSTYSGRWTHYSVISNHESPWDAEYFTQEKKALYIVYSLGTSVITICRPAFSNVAEIVGQIEYHDIRTSKICILGQEWHVDAFFRKKGFGFLTGSDRVFTGPDGMNYVWKSGEDSCKLLAKGDDGHQDRVVARYKPQSYLKYLFLGKENSCLEIEPEAEHMIDYIMVTFIYIEKLRTQRKKAAKSLGEISGTLGQ